MISFDKVCVTRDGKIVLQNITTTLREHRIGVIGDNGSGKSTFVRLINGLIKPTIGNVTTFGFDTKKEFKSIQKKVGFVSQDPDHQIIFPIVKDDLAFSLKNSGLTKEHISSHVDEILERHEKKYLKEQISYHLSGGEKQMLALMSTLIREPEFIIFDEPTTFLDHKNKLLFKKTIDNLSQSVLVVTHDLNLISHFDRILVLKDGHIAFDGTPSAATEHYLHILT